MNDKLTSAKCRLCDRMLGKRQMTSHLKACWDHHAKSVTGKATPRWFHLIVEGHYAPDYWLHLQAPANCTFDDLDGLLRAIWLECCNHLSAFEFPKKRLRFQLETQLDIAAMFQEMARARLQSMTVDYASDDALMDQTLGSRLKPGVVFSHQYDFGSTTKLALRVVGEHAAPALAGKLKVLARNEPPANKCSNCAKPATQFCQQCAEDGEGDLCDACVKRHDCSEDMVMPLINSPRTGVCGYCGPSREP